jgi:hypothetical protein
VILMKVNGQISLEKLSRSPASRTESRIDALTLVQRSGTGRWRTGHALLRMRDTDRIEASSAAMAGVGVTVKSRTIRDIKRLARTVEGRSASSHS